MKFIIAFLFVSSSGYESLNIVPNQSFYTKEQCQKYVKQHYVNHSKLYYYCVESYLIKENDNSRQRGNIDL